MLIEMFKLRQKSNRRNAKREKHYKLTELKNTRPLAMRVMYKSQVVRQLREKLPDAQRAKLGSLLFGPVEDIPDSVYQEINGELVREAALRTKGSGGPSGVDANGFKKILACKSFKRSSINLCESIATLTRRLCTEFVDPLTIEPIVTTRLIPLNKGNGEVRPIGVGEVIRRIIGNCVTRVANQDVINASGAMQVCAG